MTKNTWKGITSPTRVDTLQVCGWSRDGVNTHMDLRDNCSFLLQNFRQGPHQCQGKPTVVQVEHDLRKRQRLQETRQQNNGKPDGHGGIGENHFERHKSNLPSSAGCATNSKAAAAAAAIHPSHNLRATQHHRAHSSPPPRRLVLPRCPVPLSPSTPIKKYQADLPAIPWLQSPLLASACL